MRTANVQLLNGGYRLVMGAILCHLSASASGAAVAFPRGNGGGSGADDAAECFQFSLIYTESSSFSG
jgi:hypothetical protein